MQDGALSRAMLNWWCVVGRGEWQVGSGVALWLTIARVVPLSGSPNSFSMMPTLCHPSKVMILSRPGSLFSISHAVELCLTLGLRRPTPTLIDMMTTALLHPTVVDLQWNVRIRPKCYPSRPSCPWS